MSDRELSVVAGALSRALKPKAQQAQDALAKRWRMGAESAPARSSDVSDVIPLLDGWIRRLEREAGSDPVTQPR